MMNYGPDRIPVRIHPMVEDDGPDHVVWYGFLCGTAEFTVEEAKRYLIESETQHPDTDPRVVVTGVDEIRVTHLGDGLSVSMVRQAVHSSGKRRGNKRRDGYVLPRQDGTRLFIGVTRILTREQEPESADVQLSGISPHLNRELGGNQRVVSVDVFYSVNPSDDSIPVLWRFGVEPIR